MAKLLKLRRGTTSQHSSFTGAEGEVTVNTTKDTLVVHDGSTAGGHELLRTDLSNAPAGVIDNADVSNSAAIAGTKISPDFGSQTISTTGVSNLSGELRANGNINITNSGPKVTFTDAEDNPDYFIGNIDGSFRVRDITNNSTKLDITSSTTTISNNLDVGSGIDVTGDITSTGALTINSSDPSIYFNDSNANPDFRLRADGGTFKFIDTTNNNADRLVINSDGHVDVVGNLDVGSGVDVTGNITVSGTVDGVDVAALNTTVSGNLTTSNIASNAQIALSKLETITSNRIVGNDSGNDVPKELTAAEVRTIINVENGATADQSASDIRGLGFFDTSNDGSGSGLDADLLDGQHGSYYSNYNNLSNKPTIPTNNNQLTNGAGYITSASFSDVAGGGTFTGDVVFDGGADAVVIAGDSEIKFNNGNWTGNHTKFNTMVIFYILLVVQAA